MTLAGVVDPHAEQVLEVSGLLGVQRARHVALTAFDRRARSKAENHRCGEPGTKTRGTVSFMIRDAANRIPAGLLQKGAAASSSASEVVAAITLSSSPGSKSAYQCQRQSQRAAAIEGFGVILCQARMTHTRREWLALAALGVSDPLAFLRRPAAQEADLDSAAHRIAKVILGTEAQGFHRTATTVDRVSGDWLRDQVRQTGLVPALESFPLSRVDPVACNLVTAGRRIEGLPLFDAAFTSATGAYGSLGALNADTDIGLVETAVNASATGQLGDARRANRHKAIVAVTRGRRPGLCPSNADSFLRPFGPPVLQVSSDDADWLTEQAKRGADVQLVAHVARTSTTASNVVATLLGMGSNSAPAPRHDAAQRLVLVRKRTRRRHCLLARDHARVARRSTAADRVSSWPRADTSWVTLESTRSSSRQPRNRERRRGVVAPRCEYRCRHGPGCNPSSVGRRLRRGAVSRDDSIQPCRHQAKPAWDDPWRRSRGRAPRRRTLRVRHRGQRSVSQSRRSRTAGRRRGGDRTIRGGVHRGRSTARGSAVMHRRVDR